MDVDMESVRHLLNYNPEKGIFTWSVKLNDRMVVGSDAGTDHRNGYRIITIGRKQYQAHRLAFLYMGEDVPEYVDHINGDRLDNRWVNLRPASFNQNQHNRALGKNNKSGVKGVHWRKDLKKWQAYVASGKKRLHVGYFPDLIGAELAVRKARIELHGEFANHG